MLKEIVIILHLWLVLSHAAEDSKDPLIVRSFLRLFKDFTLNITGRSSEPRNLKRLEAIDKVQKSTPKEFPCKFRDPNKDGPSDLPLGRSEKKPTSVHMLRPGDIDVIAAMGDSLTAGSGGAATNILEVVIENKGISWSIGGQGDWRKFLTLPNIIKVFNPKLIGYSLGDTFSHHKISGLNVAEIGAMSRDLPYMARELVKRITNDKRINVKNDWKLVTVMMGANDFCLDICFINPKTIAESHRMELMKALMIIKKNLPRTLINLVVAPDVTLLKRFTGVPGSCELFHLVQCPCFFGEPHKAKEPELIKAIHQWQEVEKEIESAPELNDSEDFAVVYQSFVKNIKFPIVNGKTDLTYFSADCFHFSQKGYARASNALWNNMLEPVGNKSEDWGGAFERFLCPTKEHPYIFTPKNSDGAYKPKQPIDETTNLESNLVKRGARRNSGFRIKLIQP